MSETTKGPYIWLQPDERFGSADCGCELRFPDDGEPAFYLCDMHENALKELEQLKKDTAMKVQLADAFMEECKGIHLDLMDEVNIMHRLLSAATEIGLMSFHNDCNSYHRDVE